MKNLNIGYIDNGYPEKRTIINKVKNVEYKYKKNLLRKVLVKIEKKIFKKNIIFEPFILNEYYNKNIDGYHFFNHISKTNINFITTYETFLPRIEEFNDIHHFGDDLKIKLNNKKIESKLKLLAQENCKKIISLSKCNFNLQKKLLEKYPSYKEEIRKKMILIHPPQEILDEKVKRLEDNKIKFIYVGRDFIRKGGSEIVTAFNNVSKYVDNIELILITNLESTYNYVFKEFQDEKSYINSIKKIIVDNKKISHYTNLDNKDVIKLMKESHIGLLPTWGDTYGYSVLEFQATGCPVITTNVRALTEINNEECGWIIDLPLNMHQELGIDSKEKKEKLRKKIIEELESKFYQILSNKTQITEKSKNSLNRIKKYHCPIEYSKKIQKLYQESFINKN